MMAPAGLRRPRALLLVLAACGGAGEPGAPPEPEPAPAPPQLAGQRVMLLPARAPAPEQLDAELAFWLTDRAPTVDWVPPDELQRVADRTPAWRMQLKGLPRPVVRLGGGERRVRDPLYGALRQLGAVVDARYAVVPVTVAEHPDSVGVRLSLAMAVVDIRGGRVLWLHTTAGERNPDRRAAVASVAEAMARSLVP